MWRRIQKLLATLVPALLLVLYLGVLVSYLNRWDSLVAITLIPVWAWAGVGMGLSILSWLAFRGLIPSTVIFSLWLLTGIVGSEETHGLVRELLQTIDPVREPPEDRSYRVVHVDARESIEGLKAVADLEPDLLLIQSAPPRTEIEAWAPRCFESGFDLLAAGSQAIVASSEILDRIADPGSPAIHARIQLDNGMLIDATTLTLEQCLPRAALWKPSVWEELTEARKNNRREVRTHLGENQISHSPTGRIVSGGFLTPPGDDVFRPLESNGMLDAFATSGLGWGNTYPAHLPTLRVDQIWVSENLSVHSAEALPNPESDHRIVVTDLVLPVRQ